VAEPRTETTDLRITIERSAPALGSQGDLVDVWSTYITIWAGRRDVSTIETFRAREVAAELSARFVVRWSPETNTITPKDRIIDEHGVRYEIIGRRETLRRQWFEIDAVERPDK
jgi:head-tail adaptor